MSDTVKVRVDDTIGNIVLNRPAKLNAINDELTLGLLKALRDLNADPACRVILIRGEGAAFCAGDDLQQLGQFSKEFNVAEKTIFDLQDITREIMFNDKLVICAIQGWAVGAGFSWALNADISIWASDAGAFLPEVHYGMYATGAATFLLSHRIGNANAMEMMMRGNKYTVSRLKEMGLVSRMVEPDKLLEAAREVALELTNIPAETVRDLKHGVVMPFRDEIEAALNNEAQKCGEALRRILGSQELKMKTEKFQEGVKS